MKTKKQIYEWWIERGMLAGDRDIEDSDLSDYCGKIETKFLCTTMSTNKLGGKHIDIIYRRKWKFPLYLDFDKKGECVRIGGY